MDSSAQPLPLPLGRVLIVDDERANRLLLATMLRDEGYEVLQAENGLQGVECYQQHHPDVVLMDLFMPVMSGFEAARQIKSHSSRHYIPILFITTHTSESDMIEAIESGGDDFLSKPIHFTVLKAKIRAAMRTRQLYRDLQAEKEKLDQFHALLQQEHQTTEKILRQLLIQQELQIDQIRSYLSPVALSSGDFILVRAKSEQCYQVMLGDFTGHGLAAAIGTLPMMQIFGELVAQQLTLEAIAAEVNNRLLRILPTQIFCAAVFVEFNLNDSSLQVINAGLPALYYLGDDNRMKGELASTQLMLGIVAMEAANYRTQTLQLAAGEALYAFTDGLTEAGIGAESGEMFGENRLQQVLQRYPLAERFDRVIKEVECFSHVGERQDDMTLLEFKH
ncbi:fused response regulator/phosphatase [Ectothiorhodospiraceae bacterium BW-2]|nr:fused response regulator/phosphatase [Ectothiorhodospiraceae bacterium BW-2]